MADFQKRDRNPIKVPMEVESSADDLQTICKLKNGDTARGVLNNGANTGKLQILVNYIA